MSYTVRAIFIAGEHAIKPQLFPVNFSILLEQVNKIRIAIGIGEGKLDALPPGEQGASSHCVLARALSNGWKCEVSDAIVLIPPKESDLDWDATAKALKELGFKGVEIRNRQWRNEDEFTSDENNRMSHHRKTFVPHHIKFHPSQNMANFIERFDEGQFPDLILND